MYYILKYNYTTLYNYAVLSQIGITFGPNATINDGYY